MREKLLIAGMASMFLAAGASWTVDMNRTNGPSDAFMAMFLVGVGAMVAQCNVLLAIDDAAVVGEEVSPQPESEASDDE